MSSDLSKELKKLTIKLDETLKTFDAEKIEDAIAPVDDLHAEIRKTLQKRLKEPAKQLIKKLKEDRDLTPEEEEIAVKWVVGDEEFYTRIENNLLDWVAECKRLFTVLNKFNTKELKDENNLLALGALLTDLKFTLSDVMRYSEAMNRVDQFKNLTCVGIPNKASKRKIAQLIEQKLNET